MMYNTDEVRRRARHNEFFWWAFAVGLSIGTLLAITVAVIDLYNTHGQ